jgi:putative component of membrane protein insertase Oxa1/YidC/SpoIIIJ protein YidD
MKTIKWQSVYRIVNIFVALFLITQIVLSNLSFTKIDYALTFYLCAMAAIENMYKHGMLAGVLYLIKRKKVAP